MIAGSAIVEVGEFVGEGAQIGKDVNIWHWTHVCKGAKIGDRVSIGQGCYIGPDVVIGEGTRIQNNAFIPEGVTIGKEVFVGPSVVFTNDLHPRIGEEWEVMPTVICNNASIGANATILCGLVIGERAMIGAGAIICRNVGEGETIVGIYSG